MADATPAGHQPEHLGRRQRAAAAAPAEAAGGALEVHAVTARFGAPYIACEASYAVAQHAALDAWAAAARARRAGPTRC